MVIKRFWKLIALSIIIVAVLVTYFIHSALVVASQFPDLEIKTISGDETTLNDVAINGDYYHEDNYSSSLIVSLDGSTYYEELSYFEKLEPQFPPNEATKIKDKYRNFMRGKMYNPSSFFENDNYLAYVGAEISDWSKNHLPKYYLEVDVLNKETNTSHSFQTNLPGVKEIQHADILEVHMDQEDLKVIVNLNYYLNDQYVDEIKVYTLSISAEGVVGDQTLFDPQEQSNKDKWSHLMFLNDHSELDSGNNLLLQKDIGHYVEVSQNAIASEELDSELLEREFYIYNIKSNQLQELQIPQEQYEKLLSNEFHLNGFVKDNHAYITYLNEENLVVLSFSLEDFKVDSKQTFNLTDLGMEGTNISLMENKIYAVENGMGNSAKIFVGDVTTGEILYKGEIVHEQENDDRDDFTLNFYTITKN
ncbi:hypothetical protein [Paucisalibacillus sp. EB02]|uniref:hypothetical protein n=1 Tax=Paucisalibacillus sp. EB02 TaxID=1347087 RepID=UPI0004B8515B|nr:hypothetical protein [Paucisalibacillus sp. EB02]